MFVGDDDRHRSAGARLRHGFQFLYAVITGNVIHLIDLGRLTEGFYETAVAMPFKFDQQVILTAEGGLNKRQRCAEGLA